MLEQDLSELRKEVIEARNMNIKTETTLRGVFAELKKVAQNQQAAERRARLGSIGVYILLTLVVGTAAFYLNRVMTSNLEAEIERQRQALVLASRQAGDLRLALESRAAAESRVAFLLKLIRDGKKEEAVEEYRKTDPAKFTEAEVMILKDKFDILLAELARKHYDAGMSQWRIGGYKSAAQEFSLSQSFKTDTDYLAALLYYKGLSLLESKRFDEAAESLRNALAAGLAKTDVETARIKAADALIKAGRYEDAIKFIETVPLDQMTSWNRATLQMKMTQAKEGLIRKQSSLEAEDSSELAPATETKAKSGRKETSKAEKAEDGDKKETR